MKRIVTVQDISCIGKCSLTVALPIISACGVETAVIPTAVLSTHTAFSKFTFRDLSADMHGIIQHWKQENITFDGMYTGYLGSVGQMDAVRELITLFKTEKNFVLIDPVMGDNGKLYTGFDNDFAKKMAELCGMADIIVPNITEACSMLDEPYTECYDKAYIQYLLKKLTALGAKKAVLTGVRLSADTIGVMAYDREKDTFFEYYRPCIPQNFHGTGDVFASTLMGMLTKGELLDNALKTAVDFTVTSIEKTIDDPDGAWYGVNFEAALPLLIQ